MLKLITWGAADDYDNYQTLPFIMCVFFHFFFPMTHVNSTKTKHAMLIEW